MVNRVCWICVGIVTCLLAQVLLTGPRVRSVNQPIAGAIEELHAAPQEPSLEAQIGRRSDEPAEQTEERAASESVAADGRIRGWKRGEGWGWIWGKDDEIGALNAMTAESRLAALKLATRGEVFDLGVTYNRNSFKWPGHSPAEIMSFRSPEGIVRQQDNAFTAPQVNRLGQGWHSSALFINDNVGTQIDGLGHATVGEDHHWYNGYREADWGGDFGIRKCDAASLPPIVARGVLLDVAGLKGVEALPPHYGITPADIDRTLQAQNVEIRPGDVVLIRTGALRYWGRDGSETEKLAAHDSAGITLETARYLVEQFGAMLIASDTSGLEVQPAPAEAGSFIPVHNYLLIEQGVPIGEFHYLEDLAAARVYEFAYVALTNKIAGTVAGFCLRPVALR